MSSQVDLPVPFGLSSAADPYPDYTRLRADDGIRRVMIRPGLEPWLVTRYADIRFVLGNERMSSDPANTSAAVRQAIAAGRVEERVALFGKNLLSVDPPEHTRMRRLISSTFSARRAAALEESVTVRTEHLLDALSGQDEVDLLAEYAFPLAVSVVCRLIGVPESDQLLLCSLVRALACADLTDVAALETASEGLAEYFVPFILAKRDRPGDDLVSILATARDNDRLADHDLISMVYQLFFAGHQSSAYFTANAAFLLLTHPDQRAKLAANADLLPSAIEEMLRFESPAKVSTWRFATHPVPVGNVVIAPGEPVLALLASGSRDEARHRAPDQFLIDRADTDHLAFGYGIHHCLGAALARMESRIAISRLFARFPEIQLARPVAALRWRANLMTRGVSELPIRLNAASEGDPPWTPTEV
jgi:cytochrome P450